MFSRLQLTNEEETETPEVPQQGADAPPPYTSIAADTGKSCSPRHAGARLRNIFEDSSRFNVEVEMSFPLIISAYCK